VFQVAPHEPVEYGRFVERYAGPAYARFFAATGDFGRAQALAERMLVDGFTTWVRRHRWGQQWPEIFECLIERMPPAASPPPGLAPYSFHNSEKIRRIEGAVAVLRSFAGADGIALFLEHVCEIPRAGTRLYDLVGETVHVDRDGDGLAILDGPGYLARLNAKLDNEIARWRPDDRDAKDLFKRTMRQYALPPTFAGAVLSQVGGQARIGISSTVASLVRAGIVAGATFVLFGAFVAGPLDARQHDDSITGLALVLFADFLVLLLSWNVRRRVWFDEPRLPFMCGLDYAGLAIAGTAPYFAMSPGVFRAHTPLLAGLLLLRLLWWFASVALTMSVGVKLLRSHRSRRVC
jgi:hypothetical protein